MNASTELALHAGNLTVGFEPLRGFAITRLIDGPSDSDAIWRREGFVPAAATRELGPAGSLSIESFADKFVGGWFLMCPAVGFPGRVQGPSGEGWSHLHGEACRLPWVVERVEGSLAVGVLDLIRVPLRLRRSLRITNDILEVETTAVNRSTEPVLFTWGEHPCFRRETFAGGRIELSARSAFVPSDGGDQLNGLLQSGKAFTFPMAPGRDGRPVDICAIPEVADGRHDQCLVELSAPTIRLTAPAVGRALRLDVDLECFPYSLLWQNYRAPAASFWGAADVVAVEPIPFPGRSMAEAAALGGLQLLEPGAVATTLLKVGWEPLSG